jgi:hypothetical protein
VGSPGNERIQLTTGLTTGSSSQPQAYHITNTFCRRRHPIDSKFKSPDGRHTEPFADDNCTTKMRPLRPGRMRTHKAKLPQNATLGISIVRLRRMSRRRDFLKCRPEVFSLGIIIQISKQNIKTQAQPGGRHARHRTTRSIRRTTCIPSA